MKRSEVIEKIQGMLRAQQPEDADNILTMLQGLGMLPPLTLLHPMEVYDNAWDPEESSQN